MSQHVKSVLLCHAALGHLQVRWLATIKPSHHQGLRQSQRQSKRDRRITTQVLAERRVQPGEGAIYRCCILMETSFAKSGLSWSGCVNS
mmetsp:Transcript_59324/g.130259  ORF Transcript_59324/g.130259 Transcript_59324/m.130259 type:complete len:89 (+) Transcript_59324:869-1135(+)